MAALDARELRQRDELLQRADRMNLRRLAIRAMQRRLLHETRDDEHADRVAAPKHTA